MAKLYKKVLRGGRPSDVWYVDLRTIGGGQRSTGCTDIGAARIEARRLEREAASGQGEGGRGRRHTVGEALEHLLATTSSRSDHYDLRAFHLRRLMGAVDVNDLTLEKVVRYTQLRLAEHGKVIPPPADRPYWKARTMRVSRHTVSKELKALGRALRLARKRSPPMFQGHPEDVLPDDFGDGYKPRERWLTPEEFKKLLAQLLPHRQLWLAVAVYTGARKEEINGLRLEHIRWDAGMVELWGTKTAGAERVIPLPAPLAKILSPLREDEDGEERTTGELTKLWRWHKVWRDLVAACARAGIPPATANDLRRTYASWLAQGGRSTLEIAKLLGHASDAMAKRVYARLSQDQLAQAVRVLPRAPRRLKKRA